MTSVILLAGGSSSRFKPLSDKNLFPFLGKTFVERQIETFSKYDVDELIIIGNNDNSETISHHARDLSANVKVFNQIGSGQSGAALTALKNSSAEGDVLIVNMNDVFDESLLEDFFAMRPDLIANKHNLLTGKKVDEYFPGGYLVLDDGFVTEVQEKPGAGNEPSEYVRLVVDYFHSKQELIQALESASSKNDDVYETALTDMMNSGTKFKMLEYDGVWRTIKFPWHVLDVTDYYLKTIKGQTIHPSASISDKATIKGDVIIEEGVKIFEGAVINGPVYIGKGTIIANNSLVRDSVVGDGCVIGFASEVARSYLHSNVWLHMNYIGDSVIGHNVSFGSGTVLANLRLDEQQIASSVKGERINSGKTKLGAIIGDNVRIGVGVNTMPGAVIGSGSFVASGVTLFSDVADNSYVYLKQELNVRENRFDITTTNRDEHKNKLTK